MISEEIKAELKLPFDFCDRCIFYIENYESTRYYYSGFPSKIEVTCEHAHACAFAVRESEVDE